MPAFKEFKASPGASFSDQDAARFGRFLEQKVGLGTRPVGPETIVEAARPKRSPIHNQFEWDDGKAAQQHRISQARRMVSHIRIVVVDDTAAHKGRPIETRAFHHVRVVDPDSPSGVQTGYLHSRVVWSTPETAAQVREKARRDVLSALARARQFEELHAWCKAIDDAIAA